VELDTALVRINQQYPNIGVQISQETEFDHRENKSVLSTTTNVEGNWKINNIEPGVYHVVAEKDSFGWQYKLNQNLTSSDESISSINLLKTLYVQSILNQDILVDPGRHIIIKGNTIVNSNINFEVKEGCWLLFEKNASLLNNGGVVLVGELDEPIYISSYNNSEKWGQIENNSNSSFQLSNSVIKNSNFGIQSMNNSTLVIKNSCFKNNGKSVVITGREHLILEGLNLVNNEEGISLGTIDSANINNSIIMNNVFGVLGSNSMVDLNNVFLSTNITGIDMTASNCNLQHCNLKSNDVAFRSNAGYRYIIENNNFIANSIDIQSTYIYFSGTGRYRVNENNFINTESLYFDQRIGSLADTVHAEYNWWGTTDVSSINGKIIDYFDNQDLRVIVYQPLEVNQVETAGIINN
jgi:hypothetical protein